jgi:hypothetical protein
MELDQIKYIKIKIKYTAGDTQISVFYKKETCETFLKFFFGFDSPTEGIVPVLFVFSHF